MKTFLFLILAASLAIATGTDLDAYLEKASAFLINSVIVSSWVFSIFYFFSGGKMDDEQDPDRRFQSQDVPTLL